MRTSAARYEMMFHQVEGLVIGHTVTFSDLKGHIGQFRQADVR